MSTSVLTGSVARGRVGGLIAPLTLLLLVAAAFGQAEEGVGRLEYSEDMVKKVADMQRLKAEALGEAVAGEAAPPKADAQRIREGTEAIEDVLRAQRGEAPRARDLGRELSRIVAAEVDALGSEGAALEPKEVPVAPAPRPLASPPAPPAYTLQNQVRAGVDYSKYLATGESPLTTNIRYGEYRITFQDRPVPRSDLKLENTFYEGTLRTADTGIFTLDHQFSRRWTGTVGGTLTVERYIPVMSYNDYFLGNAYEKLVLHLPEGLDITHRYSVERKAYDRETPYGLSSFVDILEFDVEKRLAGGIARFQFLSTDTEYPSDHTWDILTTDLTIGYAAPISHKIDLDYTFVREKQNLNLLPTQAGDYVQSRNRLSLVGRLSKVMTVNLDLELENRDYRLPDTTYISHNRNLWSPLVTIQQTDHLSFGLGYWEEKYLYREFDLGDDYDPGVNDYRQAAYKLSVNYAKKRFTGSISVEFGNVHYLTSQSDLQSDYDTHDTSVSFQYAFSNDCDLNGSFARSTQLYELAPTNNTRSDSITADVTYRF
ncbi:MAG: hypothetical protein HY815_20740 [Candidatus Riflebacteria bacterium]|nr:hypothetical protein [Candidatus Riflebacteria bacterium]